MNEVFTYTLKKVKRLIIGVVGFTILLIGIALLVLPGPAFIVIPIGLALLATEFVWARKLLKRVKTQIEKATRNKKRNKAKH